MKRKNPLYEGKAKTLYTTDNPDLLIQRFKDEIYPFDGKKQGTIRDKGMINNQVSSTIFQFLENAGIETHYVRTLNEQEMLVRRLEMLPIEVVVRNVIAGSLSKRFGLPEGTFLEDPILEFYYKRDDLHDPMLNEYHIRALKLATDEEVARMGILAFRINAILSPFLETKGIRLIDGKYEFGRYKGKILLGDEISSDGCRFWDMETSERMDKDRFCEASDGAEEAYKEVWRRVCTSSKG